MIEGERASERIRMGEPLLRLKASALPRTGTTADLITGEC